MLKDEIDQPLGAIFVNQDITSEMSRLRENSDLDFSHGICPDDAIVGAHRIGWLSPPHRPIIY